MRAQLASAVVDLHSPEALKRLFASEVLERAARMVSSKILMEALGRGTVTAALAKALGDPDQKVVRNAVIAIAEIGRRYLKDDRAYPSVVRLFTSPDALTRLWALEAAVVLRAAASLPDISQLLRDRSAKVRAGVVRLALGLTLHAELSVEARAELRALAALAADDRDRSVQEFAANLMRALAVPGEAPA